MIRMYAAMKAFPRFLRFLFRSFFFLALILSIAACRHEGSAGGIVAEVNGEPIYLHSLQALVDSKYGDLIITGEDSLEEIKDLYARALSVLIVHALVRQELQKKGIQPKHEDTEKLAGSLAAEFGQAAYQDYIADGLIAESDWEDLLRDHIALRLFDERILQPRITVKLAEISEYYKEHQADFTHPELVGACLAHSASKDALEEWKRSFSPERPEAMKDVRVQEFKVAYEEMPKDWLSDRGSVKGGECGPVRQAADGWTLVCIREKISKSRLGMPEVYALIEKILRAEKSRQAFHLWLEESARQARIQVTPELNKIISLGAGARAFRQGRLPDETGDPQDGNGGGGGAKK